MAHSRGMTERARETRRQASVLKREGTGWDIGAAVRFPLSDQARDITGHVLVVDGGATLSARAARRSNRERRTHAESLPQSLLVPHVCDWSAEGGSCSPLVKPLQSQASDRPATRAGWPGWIVAGVTSGLRITCAGKFELPRSGLSRRQSIDEDARIAGDVEVPRGHEDRSKMA